MQRKCSKAVLFTIFKRPDTTERVFEAIRKVQPPRLYIAADGPRKNVKDEEEKCIKTREIVKKIDWDCDVKTLFRENNLGCAVAMSEAITWFFDNEEDGIILEDDCLPNESFFYYCEELLDRYKDNEKIMAISGYYTEKPYTEFSYFFASAFLCWGWATWKRAWKYFDLYLERYNYDDFSNTIDKIYTNDLEYLCIRKFLKNYFDTLKDSKKSKELNSWGLPWVMCIFANNGMCINPNINLVSNIGFDEDGAHFSDPDDVNANRETFYIEKIIHPKKVDLFLKINADFTNKLFTIKTVEEYIKYLEEQNSELLNLKNKFQYYVDKIAWWIPIRKLRYNFRENIYRTEQNRTEQNRTEQNRTEQ